jgi:thiopurine S-methyltransferase
LINPKRFEKDTRGLSTRLRNTSIQKRYKQEHGLQQEFWHERWQQNEIGFHDKEINEHLQQYWPAFNIALNSRIFVPLCGKSKDLLWLLAQGYEVIGVELSPLAVQAFFDENGLSATTY